MRKCNYFLSVAILLAMQLSFGAARRESSKKLVPVPESAKSISLDNMLGMSCSRQGNYALVSTETSDTDPSILITLTYSEHPGLKERETIQEIAQHLHNNQHFDDCIALQELCKEKIQSFGTLPLIEDKSSHLTPQPPMQYNLIALCISLGVATVKHSGCALNHENVEVGSLSGSFNPWSPIPYNNQIPRHICATSHIPMRSEIIVQDPQTASADLQNKHPLQPFHLLVNLAAWREHVKPIREKRKAESQKQVTAPSRKKDKCAIQ